MQGEVHLNHLVVRERGGGEDEPVVELLCGVAPRGRAAALGEVSSWPPYPTIPYHTVPHHTIPYPTIPHLTCVRVTSWPHLEWKTAGTCTRRSQEPPPPQPHSPRRPRPPPRWRVCLSWRPGAPPPPPPPESWPGPALALADQYQGTLQLQQQLPHYTATAGRPCTRVKQNRKQSFYSCSTRSLSYFETFNSNCWGHSG